ncbi:MAG: hypothetical protein R2707_06955 [Acidimicrobiales bacterium]
MRNRAILRLLAALSVVALLGAACGDDDDTTTTADDAAAADDTADETADDDMADDDMADDDGEHDHDADGEHDHDHDADGEHDTAMTDGDATDEHDHGVVDVPAEGAPTVDVEVFADPAGGVDIHVLTDDFTIAPRAASTDHVAGEGHFHLYVDGEKVLRFYNEWIHYAGVVEGDVDIAVELSANDHRAYAVDGEPITARVTFTVPPHDHDSHSHDEAAPVEFVGDAPTIALEVVDDPKSGWNAFVTVDGMVLSPEHASGEHVDGEGHLHIYANGQKLGRLYGPATHIAALPEGEVEISVVAYTNDHQPYVVGGQPISAATTVTVAS